MEPLKSEYVWKCYTLYGIKENVFYFESKFFWFSSKKPHLENDLVDACKEILMELSAGVKRTIHEQDKK